MYRKRKNDWQKHIDFIIADIIMLVLAIWISTSIKINTSAIYTFITYRQMVLSVIFANVLYVIAAKPYSGIVFRDFYHEMRSLTYHIAFVTAGFLVFAFALKTARDLSRQVTFFFMLYSFCLMLGEREILKAVVKKRNPKRTAREVVLAANYGDALKMLSKLEERSPSGFDVLGIILLGANIRKDNLMGVPIVAKDLVSAERYLETNVVDEIILIDPDEDSYYEELLKSCDIMGLTVHVVIKGVDELGEKTFESIAGVDTISSCMRLVSSSGLLVKRITDIIGSIIGLLFTGLLFIIFAPAIYISDPGPVFFKQTRVGRNGRTFEIYKFRSMYQDAEERKKLLMDQNEMSGQIFKMEHDPRIIGSGPDGKKRGVGWLIRSFSIDEFPQFLNVLKGDMSLVGTRPPTLDEWEKYEKHHRKRMRVRPGITGLWQISGRNEITDFEEIVSLDAKYIREWSIWLDLEILLKTIWVVITRKGSK